MPRPSARLRHRPQRYGHQEVNVDGETGAHDLIPANADEEQDDGGAPPEEEESEDAALASSETSTPELPPIPPSFFRRTRQRRTNDADTSEGAPDVSPNPPLWVVNLGMEGITFNNDYAQYWCKCGKTPDAGWVTGGGRGNISKHRNRATCTFDVRQMTLFQRAEDRRLTQGDSSDLYPQQ